eukprot:bmy_12042T0
MDLTSYSFPLFKDPMLPLFEGDDLRRLAQEITKARSFLWQAQSFRYALQAAPPTCLMAPAHPDPGAPSRQCPLGHDTLAPRAPALLLPARPRNLGIEGPSFFISCSLGPNSRRKTTQNRRSLRFRKVFSERPSYEEPLSKCWPRGKGALESCNPQISMIPGTRAPWKLREESSLSLGPP